MEQLPSMMQRVFILAALALAPLVSATSCTYQTMSGTCQDTSTSCAGGYYESAPICPGPNNIQCCIKKPCSSGGVTGHCMNTADSCNGHFDPANLCPGDQSIQCCLPNSGGGGGSQKASIVSHAAAQIGKLYSWDAGDNNGATTGCCCDGYNDCNRVGFDCSGLTKYAVYQATGISLPHYTGSQYTHPNCKRIPLASASTGDLLFWRSAGSSNAADAHVAILQDSKTLIEAYDTQDGVIRDARRGSTSGETIEPYACRFWTS